MINPEFAHEIGVGIGALAPIFSAVIIRLSKDSKIIGLFHGESGKGSMHTKKLVSGSGDEFIFVPTAGNASFTVETAGNQQFVEVEDYYPGEKHNGWARIWVDHKQDLDLEGPQINTSVPIPGIPGAKALYTGHEGMNKDLLAQLKTTLRLQERN